MRADLRGRWHFDVSTVSQRRPGETALQYGLV